MPDSPLERMGGQPYDPSMEARLARLEEDMRDVKASLHDVREAVIRLEALFTATVPHLATKADVLATRADLAEKPSKAYMWGILAVLLTAYASGLAALAVLR
jgi:hypothetical protein